MVTQRGCLLAAARLAGGDTCAEAFGGCLMPADPRVPLPPLFFVLYSIDLPGSLQIAAFAK